MIDEEIILSANEKMIQSNKLGVTLPAYATSEATISAAFSAAATVVLPTIILPYANTLPHVQKD